MKKHLLLSIISLTFMSLASCSVFKDFGKDQQDPEVRFVDLNGNPRSVQLKTPPQNIDALNKQGNLSSKALAGRPAAETDQTVISQNKYANPQNVPQANAGSALAQTLAMPVEEAKIDAQNDQIEEKAEYDLAQIDEVQKHVVKAKEGAKPIAAKIATKEKKAAKTSAKLRKGYYAQIGSFTSNHHAEIEITRAKKIMPKAHFHIQDAVVKGKKYHRVLVGPYKARKQANGTVSAFKSKGKNAILTKVK